MNNNTGENPALRLNEVSVSYRYLFGKQFRALSALSLEIQEGEILGVVGTNGSGKSTLIKLIAGIFEPDTGDIERFGHNTSLLSLKLGFLPHLTGRQNAVLSGMMHGLSHRAMTEKLPDVINLSSLGNVIDDPLKTYSTGMVARLGFAVAVQANSDILLVDEVLGVGDMEFRSKSTRIMREKIQEGKTVVVVSHQLPTIEELCDRVLWLHEGSVKMIGSTEEVLDAYKQFFRRRKKRRKLRQNARDEAN